MAPYWWVVFGTGVPRGETHVGVPLRMCIRPRWLRWGSSSLVRLWYLHNTDRLSMFVGPPRAHGVMWWTSQLSAACRQSGTGHVVNVARARSRCLALANRFAVKSRVVV